MVNQLPIDIQSVLHNQLGVYPYSFLKIDPDGRILDAKGAQPNLGCLPQCGDPVEIYFEAFTNMFPLNRPMEGTETTVIANVELKNQKIFNIYLLSSSTDTWIVFVETTEAVKQIKTLLQKYNEHILHSHGGRRSGETGWSIGLLQRLGFTCFEHIEGSYFRLLDKPAEWSYPVFRYLEVNAEYFDLVDHHPFLEVFLNEAKTFWEKRTENALQSGLWSEQDEEGNCYAVKAVACFTPFQKLLLLGPAENSAENVQKLIQKARERSLDYEEMKKTQTTLKKMIAFKNQFVSIVSHDLRAPLASVITMLRLLVQGYIPRPDDTRNTKDFLQLAQSELEKVLDYNQKIYDWTNLELGRFQIELEWHNLAEILEDIIQTHAQLFKEKGISLGSELEADFMVHVDKTLFYQLMSNLVNNARKFTPRKGQVTLKALIADSGLELQICDTGVGMDASSLDEAFSDYFSQHTKGTSDERGSGLGLSICKKILDAHRFDVQMESRKNKGTTVKIFIPHKSMKQKPFQGKKGSKKKGFLKFF